MAPPTRFAEFENLVEVGRGSTGVVYRARDRHRARVVAIKMLPLTPVADYVTRATRFFREARALATLFNPPGNAIPSIYQVGECEGQRYYVREFVEGTDFEQAVKSSLVDPRTAVRILCKTAEVVQWIHGRGFAHRSLRPSNILVSPESQPKLIGFGMVGLLEGSDMLPPGGRGVPVDVDIGALQAMLEWLCTLMRKPVPPHPALTQRPDSCPSVAAFVEALTNCLDEGFPE